MRVNQTIRLITSFVIVLALGGCAEQWAKPGGTRAEFDATQSQCAIAAQNKFPPRLRTVQVSDGYTNPVETQCETSYGKRGQQYTDCTTTGGDYVPPSYGTVDDNKDARDQQTRSCMINNGWISQGREWFNTDPYSAAYNLHP